MAVSVGSIAPDAAYGQIKEEQVTIDYTLVDTETAVREYFSDIPIMVEVARCESTFRHHLADGSVLTGRVDNRDTGVMQINTYYHGETAEALGLDLWDLEENMEYARYLYEKQGVQPWSASRPCWGRQLASL